MRPSFVELLRLWSIRFVLIGGFFMMFGTGLNRLVIAINDHVMPVATTQKEILLVIGPEEHLAGFELVAVMGDGHRKMASTDKLSYLSDRILIIPSDTSALFGNMCTAIGLVRLCPLSAHLRMASIGDLMIWAGVPFLFLALLVLFRRILLRCLGIDTGKTTRT